jgi:hypothetical protein
VTILHSIEVVKVGAERRQMLRVVIDRAGILTEVHAPCYFIRDLPDAAQKVVDATKQPLLGGRD